MSVLMIDRLRALADRAWMGADMARTLRKAADTMENQQTHIRALQKELHEVKSERDAAIAGQETLQRAFANYQQVTEALQHKDFGSFDELLATISQVKAERDALFEEVRGQCHTCKKRNTGFDCERKCYGHRRGSAWEWRGINGTSD